PRRLMDASSVRVPGRAPRWIVPTVKVFLVSADAIAATLSFIIAFMYREGVSAFFGQWRWSNQFAQYGTLLILAAGFLHRGGFTFRSFSYARGVFVADFFFVLIGIGAIRFAMRAAQTIVRKRKINLIPT